MNRYSNYPLILKLFSLAIIFFQYSPNGVSQGILLPVYDTAYYESYTESIIGRIYLSHKYTNLQLEKGNHAPRLRYMSNTKVSVGLGAAYHGLSLNVAYGVAFLDKEKGKTKKLDLQTRLYSRKWAIDAFGQFYKGYYLFPKGRGHEDNDSYYLRPDLKINLGGISAYKIFNYKRFTLRPAFVQDEIQKKSAGSFMAGAEAYYTDFHADSALVPSQLESFYDARGIRRVRFFKIGPGVGYAYTQVLPLHLFITASLTANVNLTLVQETGITSGMDNHVSASANLLSRVAAGYNNGKWTLVAFWLNNRNTAKGAFGNDYIFNMGNFRLIFAKRIEPGPKAKKFLDRVL